MEKREEGGSGWRDNTLPERKTEGRWDLVSGGRLLPAKLNCEMKAGDLQDHPDCDHQGLEPLCRDACFA